MDRSISSINLVCQQPGHEGQQLIIVCYDRNCRYRGLTCQQCYMQQHQNHEAIQLGVFLNSYKEQINLSNRIETLQKDQRSLKLNQDEILRILEDFNKRIQDEIQKTCDNFQNQFGNDLQLFQIMQEEEQKYLKYIDDIENNKFKSTAELKRMIEVMLMRVKIGNDKRFTLHQLSEENERKIRMTNKLTLKLKESIYMELAKIQRSVVSYLDSLYRFISEVPKSAKSRKNSNVSQDNPEQFRLLTQINEPLITTPASQKDGSGGQYYFQNKSQQLHQQQIPQQIQQYEFIDAQLQQQPYQKKVSIHSNNNIQAEGTINYLNKSQQAIMINQPYQTYQQPIYQQQQQQLQQEQQQIVQPQFQTLGQYQPQQQQQQQQIPQPETYRTTPVNTTRIQRIHQNYFNNEDDEFYQGNSPPRRPEYRGDDQQQRQNYQYQQSQNYEAQRRSFNQSQVLIGTPPQSNSNYISGVHNSGSPARSTSPDQMKIMSSANRLVWPAHESCVKDILFMDIDKIISCSNDTKIKIWDKLEGRLLITLQGHQREVECLAYNHTNRMIASGSADKEIRIWRPVPNWQTVVTLKGHSDTIKALLFQNERVLFSGAMDGLIKVWDIEKGCQTKSLDVSDGKVWSLLIVQNMRLLAGCNKIICAVDLRNYQKFKNVDAHENPVTKLLLLRRKNDQPLVISCSKDCSVKLWEASTMIHLRTIQETIPILSVTYINDIDSLAIGMFGYKNEGKITIYSLETFQLFLELMVNQSGASQVLWDQVNKFLYSCHDNKAIEYNKILQK